jgi:putative ABC transport system permease protein
MLPLRGSNWGSFAVAEGDGRPREEWLQAQYRWVSPGFFEAMGLPVLTGRAMGALDGDRGVAVASERIAEQLWPGDTPLGRWFGPDNPPDEQTRLEVVGVVPDVHSTDLAAARIPIVYVPLWRPGSPVSAVVVRTAVEPSAVVGTLRRVVSAMDPELPVANVQSMQDVERASVATRRFQLLAVGSFAAVTLLIALTGIYSALAYRARGRTREIAVRMALGARPGSVVRMMVGQGLVPVLLGRHRRPPDPARDRPTGGRRGCERRRGGAPSDGSGRPPAGRPSRAPSRDRPHHGDPARHAGRAERQPGTGPARQRGRGR